jgi:hypothetical protein
MPISKHEKFKLGHYHLRNLKQLKGFHFTAYPPTNAYRPTTLLRL